MNTANLVGEYRRLRKELVVLRQSDEFKQAKKDIDTNRTKDYSNFTSDARSLTNAILASGKAAEIFKMVRFEPKFLKI